MKTPERNPLAELLYAQKEDLEARALREVARWIAVIGLCILAGIFCIPFVLDQQYWGN